EPGHAGTEDGKIEGLGRGLGRFDRALLRYEAGLLETHRDELLVDVGACGDICHPREEGAVLRADIARLVRLCEGRAEQINELGAGLRYLDLRGGCTCCGGRPEGGGHCEDFRGRDLV